VKPSFDIASKEKNGVSEEAGLPGCPHWLSGFPDLPVLGDAHRQLHHVIGGPAVSVFRQYKRNKPQEILLVLYATFGNYS
jgi:hypothetical protein